MMEELNLYSSISNPSNQQEIAELFRTNGWEIRKCSWYDYEATRDDFEIIIEKNIEGLILVHGIIDRPRFKEIETIFIDHQLNFKMELYQGNELIKSANKC